ncbi:MAG: hypothetical protein ABWY08_10820 [Comamonas sp.]
MSVTPRAQRIDKHARWLRAGLMGLLVCAGGVGTAVHASPPAVQPPASAPSARSLDFEQVPASEEARHTVRWVIDSGDSRGLPFAIVDKRAAQVFVFDASGKLRGVSPALLGMAIGDDSAPGIGSKKMSDIRAQDRTTPAGRFVANLDSNLKGEEILWVDYDTAISLHRVVAGTARERRAQRLLSASPADRRISYGCINVPIAFYDNVVSPVFTGTFGIVYVLPETRSAREVFGSYDVPPREPPVL